MADQLLNHIIKLVPSFENEVKGVLSYFEKKRYPKGHNLIVEQTSIDSFYFVNTGCLHLYYTDESGGQHTIHFALENWWITEYNSFLGRSSAQFGITSLEETEVMVISKTQFDRLLLEYPFMGIYYNLIHMKAYGASLLKQKTFATISKRDFYSYFTKQYPELIKRIPHQILASYIGVSPEELTFFKEQILS
ncbi:Crp/Fnr family transcriptional regulator [Sporocytophaga myxococcoides]|uniref:Crp/Fnr family transcriptional regulator n=1 Tax=Sporocytophaga myxococcoides TaxID=153721 RepID=UPI000427617D|nr:Crp/Fnr family transcriptional regulator [Sporocytophaga myxococcoides]